MKTAITKQQVQESAAFCIEITRRNSGFFSPCFPRPSAEGGIYQSGPNVEWTPGFFTGMHWLCYEHTGDDLFRTAAEKQVVSFEERITKRIGVDHHDLGFLYSLSCVAAWKLTGNLQGRTAALLAAHALSSRFQEKGGFIQAWGEVGRREHYRMIIDCLLNVPLLFWAAGESNNESYREQAIAHCKTAMRYLIREDYSTYHTFYFDIDNGAPLRGETAQGYRDDTAWARGQAWAIYGLALYYRYTKEHEVLDVFDGVSRYFLSHLSKDGIPYWDLSFPADSQEPWDSSASAIAICGLLEMADLLAGREIAEQYRSEALQLAGSLAKHCQAVPGKPGGGLLLHGVYNKKSPYNAREDQGVDECNLWGDYFWLEALTRITGKWDPYW